MMIYALEIDPEHRPADGDNVRTTVTAVVPDADSSVMADAPEFNEINYDGITEGGLTPAQVASSVIPSERFPGMPQDHTGDAIQSEVNDGISTKGYSPALEAVGRWGHGTMKIVQGIEPAISSAPFDNTYFAVDHRPVESTDYMTPSAVDTSAQRAGAVGANNASMADSPYDALKGW